jgi:hypothetical protein
MAKGKKRALPEAKVRPLFAVFLRGRACRRLAAWYAARGGLCAARHLTPTSYACVRACLNVCVLSLARSRCMYVCRAMFVCVCVCARARARARLCIVSLSLSLYVFVLRHAVRTQERAAATSGGEDDAAAPTRPKKQKKTAR